MPPVAIPGLPVGLTHAFPSGNAMMVRSPFSTRMSMMLAREVARDVEPVGLDVLDRHAGQPRHFAGMRSEHERTVAAVEPIGMAFEMRSARRRRAPAEPWSHVLPGARIRTVSGLRPMPGPMATTVIGLTSCSNGRSQSRPWRCCRCRFPAEARSSTRRRMPATLGSTLPGVATVLRPATGTQRRHSRHGCGAGLAERAAHDQHVTVHAFVAVRGTRRQAAKRSRVVW